MVLRPYFPGYVFVWLDLSRDTWRSVNGTFGVVRIVMQGDRPVPAPRGLVETLVSCCGADGVLASTRALELGQRVRVSDGPFTDLVGELEQLDETGRVRVLLDLMGRSVPTWLSRSSVTPGTGLL